jgi:hypothetical protein
LVGSNGSGGGGLKTGAAKRFSCRPPMGAQYTTRCVSSAGEKVCVRGKPAACHSLSHAPPPAGLSRREPGLACMYTSSTRRSREALVGIS